MTHLSGESRSRWITAALLYSVSVVAFAQGSVEKVDPEATAVQQSVDTRLVARTGSTRQTLQSWLNVAHEAVILYKRYRQDPTHANVCRLSVNTRVLLDLLDLSQAPAALRHETGFKATYALADILTQGAVDTHLGRAGVWDSSARRDGWTRLRWPRDRAGNSPNP